MLSKHPDRGPTDVDIYRHDYIPTCACALKLSYLIRSSFRPHIGDRLHVDHKTVRISELSPFVEY